MTTTDIFLEAELVMGRQEVVSKSIKYIMLKQLRYHRTNRDPTKIIEGKSSITRIAFRYRNHITSTKTFRHMTIDNKQIKQFTQYNNDYGMTIFQMFTREFIQAMQRPFRFSFYLKDYLITQQKNLVPY